MQLALTRGTMQIHTLLFFILKCLLPVYFLTIFKSAFKRLRFVWKSYDFLRQNDFLKGKKDFYDTDKVSLHSLVTTSPGPK